MISSTDIRDYLESEKYDFKTFPIKLTDAEATVINNLQVAKQSYFEYFGGINLLDFEDFFSKIGNDLKSVKIIEKVIRKITKKVLSGFGMDHFWISVRAALPSSRYDVPRWHYDGPYFSNITQQAKFAMILKGPGTLFIKKSKKVVESYNKILDQSRKEFSEILGKNKIDLKDYKAQFEVQNKNDEKYRLKFAKELSKYKVKQIKNNKGVIFWGGKNWNVVSALHSEPKIDQPRLFISILPGTKEMIEEYENTLKEFNKSIK